MFFSVSVTIDYRRKRHPVKCICFHHCLKRHILKHYPAPRLQLPCQRSNRRSHPRQDRSVRPAGKSTLSPPGGRCPSPEAGRAFQAHPAYGRRRKCQGSPDPFHYTTYPARSQPESRLQYHGFSRFQINLHMIRFFQMADDADQSLAVIIRPCNVDGLRRDSAISARAASGQTSLPLQPL